jgi:IS5 family transposase
VAPVNLIHRGKHKSLTVQEKRWLKRRQAIEPLIGHTKSDHRMGRCWLKGALGDALHALSCAVGYNIRWLLRAIVRLGIQPLFLRLIFVVAIARICIKSLSALRLESCQGDGASPQRWATPGFSAALA